MSEYRHELKHELTGPELLALRARLKALLTQDPHSHDGCYHVRSLYFDDALPGLRTGAFSKYAACRAYG